MNMNKKTMDLLGRKIISKSSVWLLLTLLSGAATAEIYQYTDSSGNVYLTDRRMPSSGYVLEKRLSFDQYGSKGNKLTRPSGNKWTRAVLKKRRDKLEPVISRVARENSIKPDLLHAVIRVESAYNVKALSPKGAQGLMQLMPQTAKSYGASDPFDARQNISAGARYLRYLLKRYNQNLELALAAYNAGETAVDKYGKKIPPYPETRNYVKKVMMFYTDKSRTG